MQGSYIRNLNITYTDPTQKIIHNQQLPKKFTQLQHLIHDDSQYKPKPPITIIHPPIVAKPIIQPPQQQNCFTRLFSCLKLELCPQCKQHLCGECRESRFLKLGICEVCKRELCPACRRVLQGKKVKLRNYRIKLKNIKQLHFHDCDCQDCETDRQRHHHQ